ncbi:MAG: hypothetical protein ACFFB3_23685, partial [Candidatus Hodarchaeota archaeon]
HLWQRPLQIQYYLFFAILIFLASLPNIASSLHKANSVQNMQRRKQSTWGQLYVILVTIIGFAALLLLSSQNLQEISDSGTAGYSGIGFFTSNTSLAAVSMLLIVTLPLLIRFLNAINSKIGSRIWKSHTHRKMLALQFFQEDAQYLAHPALVLFLTLILLVPSLVLTPSINSHLEGESRLVVGSTLLIENWEDTIPDETVRTISPRIVETSLVQHIVLKGRFPPLYEQLSILVIDPPSFTSVAYLNAGSKDPLISIESIKRLTTNETLLLGSSFIGDFESGDFVSFTAWKTRKQANQTLYIPYESKFQIIDFFDLFPLLSIETHSLIRTGQGTRFVELVMGYKNWMNLANLTGLN